MSGAEEWRAVRRQELEKAAHALMQQEWRAGYQAALDAQEKRSREMEVHGVYLICREGKHPRRLGDKREPYCPDCELERLQEAVRSLMAPVELSGTRCLAQDGPVGDDLLLVAKDPELRRAFDRGYRKLRKLLGGK